MATDTNFEINVTDGLNYSLVTNITADNRTYVPSNTLYGDYYVAALILSWINAVLIISLNSAVIVTILRYKKRSRLYFLLLNLAIADLLTGITDTLPHSIERTIGLPYFQMLWVFGEVACKIQKALANMPLTASNYILAATSVDRAMVIFRPMVSFKRDSKREIEEFGVNARSHVLQKCIIVGCWVFSFLVSSPYFKFVKIMGKAPFETCTMDLGDNPLLKWKIFIIVMFVYVFAIPFVVIVVSYAILLVSIYRRTMSSKSLLNHAPIAGSQVFNRRLPKSKIKSIKLTCGIIVGFLLSWIVFFVVMFMNIFEGFNHPIIMIAMTSYFWNSVANPVLFFIYHRRRPRPKSHSMDSSVTGRTTYSTELRLSTTLPGSYSFNNVSPNRAVPT